MADRIRLLLGRRLLELEARRSEADRAAQLETKHPRREDAESLRRRAVEDFGQEPAGRAEETPEGIHLPLDPREQTILSRQWDLDPPALAGMTPLKPGGRKPG